MTAAEAKRKLLTLAAAEIGYHEKTSAAQLDDKTANSGTGNFTKYARDLDAVPDYYNGKKQGFAWCDVFVDDLFKIAFGADVGREMLCQPKRSAGAGCYYSALYFRQAGRFYSTPEVGDQVFFTFTVGEVSHTGIVETVADGGTLFSTIEGNTSDSVGRRAYRVGSAQIYGFGRPRWDLAADEETPVSDSDTKPKPAAKPETYTVSLPEVKLGDEGTLVERIQTLLIARGYDCGGRHFSGREYPDGDFGPATEAAIRDIQLAYGIYIDGVVGEKTMTALLTL